MQNKAEMTSQLNSLKPAGSLVASLGTDRMPPPVSGSFTRRSYVQFAVSWSKNIGKDLKNSTYDKYMIEVVYSFTESIFLLLSCSAKRPSIRRSQSWRRAVCPIRIRRRSSSDAEVRNFWRKKTSNFPKFMACPHGQYGRGGWASVDILRGRGLTFGDFVRTSFMDGWMGLSAYSCGPLYGPQSQPLRPIQHPNIRFKCFRINLMTQSVMENWIKRFKTCLLVSVISIHTLQ